MWTTYRPLRQGLNCIMQPYLFSILFIFFIPYYFIAVSLITKLYLGTFFVVTACCMTRHSPKASYLIACSKWERPGGGWSSAGCECPWLACGKCVCRGHRPPPPLHAISGHLSLFSTHLVFAHLSLYALWWLLLYIWIDHHVWTNLWFMYSHCVKMLCPCYMKRSLCRRLCL